MEQDSLYNNIRKAAENAETKDFPNMEKIWSRVENQLDQKILKKENSRWKKIALGSSVMLVAIVAFLWFRNEVPQDVKTQPSKTSTIVATDTLTEERDSVAKIIVLPTDTAPITENTTPTTIEKRPALSEVEVTSASVIKDESKTETGQLQKGKVNYSTPTNQPTKNHGVGVRRTEDFSNPVTEKSTGTTTQQKERPLLVVDGKTAKYVNLNGDDIDNVEILDDPLYIINGQQYTELELFGPNPTSPYAPLDKQEIESIKILQGKEAVAAYGEKGKKGVAIIFTKNRKPAGQKK